jgi:hypothetical protein
MIPNYHTVDIVTRAYVSLPEVVPPLAAPLIQDTVIFVLGAEHIYVMLPIGKELIIGRQHPTNKTQPELDLTPYGAEAAGTSRLHAALRREKNGWWLIDMSSSNGTWVNEERLAPFVPCLLAEANYIFLGNLELSIMLPAERYFPLVA